MEALLASIKEGGRVSQWGGAERTDPPSSVIINAPSCLSAHLSRKWCDLSRTCGVTSESHLDGCRPPLPPPPPSLPLTRCEVCTYGDFLDNATWMDAGPHSMKLALLRSRIRCKLL